MPSSTLVFTPRDESVTQFRALFEVKQDCQLGDDVEVNVSIPVKQMQLTVSVIFFHFDFGSAYILINIDDWMVDR